MATIELSEQSAQPVLSIRVRTRVEALPTVIGEGYGKIFGYLNEVGEAPAGAPYTAYYNMDMQDLDVEMGFPVAKPLPGRGEIKAGTLPAGRVVAAMYKGPYSGMEPVYKEMAEWICANGYEPTGVSYEYYFNAPGEVPESELLTRIVMPIK